MNKKELVQETCDLIREIYKRNCVGGALHIVLDDGNTDSHFIHWCLSNSIRAIEDDDERMLYVKCACNLLEIGGEKERDKCISMASRQMAQPPQKEKTMNIEISADGKCIVCGEGGFLRQYNIGSISGEPPYTIVTIHNSCYRKMKNKQAEPIALWKSMGAYADNDNF